MDLRWLACSWMVLVLLSIPGCEKRPRGEKCAEDEERVDGVCKKKEDPSPAVSGTPSGTPGDNTELLPPGKEEPTPEDPAIVGQPLTPTQTETPKDPKNPSQGTPSQSNPSQGNPSQGSRSQPTNTARTVRCSDMKSLDVYVECRYLGDNFATCYDKAGCWQNYDVPDQGAACNSVLSKMAAKHPNTQNKWINCKK